MDKRHYYISVGSGEILTDKTIAGWELEIEATESEVEALQRLFEQTDGQSWSTFWNAHIPFKEYDEGPNVAFDNRLKEVYRKIYELGTPETKEHIRKMDIL